MVSRQRRSYRQPGGRRPDGNMVCHDASEPAMFVPPATNG
jgi:hypothetical protein